MTETQYREECLGHSPTKRVLHDLGFFGHYLHIHAGGRSGKQHILIKLLLSGGSMTQRELAEALPISTATLSEVISKLEGEGLVERSRSASDKRQLTVVLTDAGKGRAEELLGQFKRFEEDAFSCLTEDEMGLLLGMLDRIVDHWHTLDARAGKEA